MQLEFVFPKVYIPVKYKKVVEAMPPLPPSPIIPIKPIEPIKEQKLKPDAGCLSTLASLFIIVLGFVLIAVFGDKTNGGQVILCSCFFIGLGCFSLYFNYQITSDYESEVKNAQLKFDNEMDNYLAAKKKYEISIKEYSQNLLFYEASIKSINNADRVNEFRLFELEKYFASLKKPSDNNKYDYQQHQFFIDNYLSNKFKLSFSWNTISICESNFSNLYLDIKILPGRNDVKKTSFVNIPTFLSLDDRVTIYLTYEHILLQPEDTLDFILFVLDKIKKGQPILENRTNLSLVECVPNDYKKTIIEPIDDLPF